MMMKSCVYCDESYTGKSSEHIVPRVLGGTRMLSGVCPLCNNGVLSQVDTALGCTSLLAIAASNHLGNVVPHLWDVEREHNGLLSEVYRDVASDTTGTYPQIIFDPYNRQIRGDYDEVFGIGAKEFERRLVIAAKECLRAYEKRERSPKLILERIESPFLSDGYRYPPRIFSSHSMNSSKFGRSMILRDQSDHDRRRAFDAIENWDVYKSLSKSRMGSSSRRTPSVHMVSDPRKIIRGLMKLGFNIASASLGSEALRHSSWSRTLQCIRGEQELAANDFKNIGFVDPDDVEVLGCSGNCHTFLVSQYDHHWHITASFFGREVAASIKLAAHTPRPGAQCKIVVPLRRNKWDISSMPIFCVLNLKPDWGEIGEWVQRIGISNFRQKRQPN